MSQERQSEKTQRRRVTFKLEALEAKEAILVGGLNGWDAKKHIIKRDNKGKWTKIVTLSPGRYEYRFLVDGNWQNDPGNDQKVSNCFGTQNSVLNV